MRSGSARRSCARPGAAWRRWSRRSQYKRELRAGDIVSVHSVLLEIKDKSVRFVHEMRNVDTGEIAATTTLTAVHFDTVARRACAFPDSVRAKASAMLAVS